MSRPPNRIWKSLSASNKGYKLKTNLRSLLYVLQIDSKNIISINIKFIKKNLYKTSSSFSLSFFISLSFLSLSILLSLSLFLSLCLSLSLSLSLSLFLYLFFSLTELLSIFHILIKFRIEYLTSKSDFMLIFFYSYNLVSSEFHLNIQNFI